jgi:ligand-binding sensor domain-containing protein
MNESLSRSPIGRENQAGVDMGSVLTAFLLMLLIIASGVRTHGLYNFRSWTADDELPQNSVFAILRTRDGYLRFTTLDGLIRFDGVSFNNFSQSNEKTRST